MQMSRVNLQELFGASPAGEIPSGRGQGTVVVAPGTRLAGPVATVTRMLMWQGKLFRPASRDLVNLLTPLGRPAVRADVSFGDSWIDGRPCIVLDYSKSSRVARMVRDEIRQIGPHEYLGVVFRGSHQLRVHFLLSFSAA